MTFGQSALNFLVNSPAAVAQSVATRLRLWEGEWFLDLTAGTPYWQQILAQKNLGLATAAVRERIASTPFVTGISNFSVSFNGETREFVVTGVVSTDFGQAPISIVMVGPPPGGFQVGTSSIGGTGAL